MTAWALTIPRERPRHCLQHCIPEFRCSPFSLRRILVNAVEIADCAESPLVVVGCSLRIGRLNPRDTKSRR